MRVLKLRKYTHIKLISLIKL